MTPLQEVLVRSALVVMGDWVEGRGTTDVISIMRHLKIFSLLLLACVYLR